MQTLVDYLVYLVVRIVICIAQAIRFETGQSLAKGLAWVCSDVLKVRGKVVSENLRQAFPNWSESRYRRVARRMWEHLFLLALEVAHTPRKMHDTNWRRFVRLANQKDLVRLLLSNRPCVIVTGHIGNFEAGGYILGILGFPTYTVARTLDNRFLNAFVDGFRGGTGQYIIPKNGGYDQIMEVMDAGGTLTLLSDQHAGNKGCWVDFFGRPASAHKAIALLALESKAVLAVSGVRRLGTMRFELGVRSMFDPEKPEDDRLGTVRGLTQWYTHELEAIISTMPDQYWWLHRRWREKPKRKKRKAA